MNRLIHRTVTTALLVAVFVVWVLLMRAGAAGTYFEPTEDALAVAADVVPRGIVLSLLLLLAVAGLAWWTHWRPFLVLGFPGLVTGALFVLVAAPSSAGSAFVYGLLSSIISLVVLAALAVHASLDQVSQKRDETARALLGPGPHTVELDEL
jgi:hypothetical protein